MKICCEENRPIMVFVYDGGTFKSYSCCLSSRRSDGSYVKEYVTLFFAEGKRPKNRDLIFIKDAFIVVLGTDEKPRLAFYVSDYEVVSDER